MPALFNKWHALYISDDKALTRAIRTIIGFTPAKIKLYKQAFSHSSISNNVYENNERLEFLGDSVINLIIADYLFNKFPKKSEGDLTELRSKIVSRVSLNNIALKMGIDKVLFFKKDAHIGASAMGNALESLVGAIYVECGYEKTRNFVVKKIVLPLLDIYEMDKQENNYKSRILEWAQKNQAIIKFVLLGEKRVRRDTEFTIGVELNGEVVATATARNKKDAEKKAAEKMFHSHIGVSAAR